MLELWFVVAIAAAILNTAYSAFQKRLTADYDGLELSYVTSVLGSVFLFPVGAWYFLTVDLGFTTSVVVGTLISGVANVGAIVTFLTALRMSDLSIVAPLRQSVPIFVAVTEPFVLAVQFEPSVVFGAIAVVVGTYILLIDGEPTTTSPERILRSPALLALTAAVLFAVASLANRFVVTRIPPLLYAFLIYLFMTIGLLLTRHLRRKTLLTTDYVSAEFVVLGGLTALRTSAIYIAFSLAIASRVTTVLQTSIILDVLVGSVVFAEEDTLRKLMGAGVIATGVLLTL